MLLKSNLGIDDDARDRWEDIHKGETAIIVGNGESLNTVPEELLGKYPTFGANHIYLMPFQPTYYICIDTQCLEGYAQQIYGSAQGAMTAFLADEHINSPMPGVEKLYGLENVYLCNENTFRFPGEYWWTGGTATYVSLKIAYFMGFSTAILVGCDRDKEWKHFSDEYPLPHAPPRYQKKQEYHMGIAGIVYEAAGRRIVNLSPPSGLDEFYERGDISEFM
jgi:hypothetical protein